MLTEGDLLLATDSDLNRIVTQAESDPTKLTEEGWSRFGRYAITRIGSLAQLLTKIVDSK
jgi:hypothetical protein